EGGDLLALNGIHAVDLAIAGINVDATSREDTGHFIVTVDHQGSGFRLCQGLQQNFQVLVSRDGAQGDQTAGELIEFMGGDVRQQHGVALAGTEIVGGNGFVGVRLDLQIETSGQGFNPDVFHVACIGAGGSQRVPNAEAAGFGGGCGGGASSADQGRKQ